MIVVTEGGHDVSSGNGRLDPAEIDTTYTLGHDILAQQNDDIEGGDTLQLVSDGHGSTRALVDEAAAVVQRYAYDAYGNMRLIIGVTVDAPSALTRFLYSGEQTDATGLQYLRARYYDPSIGRFTTLDAFAGNVQDPISLHKYLYTHGNPVIFVDPRGTFPSFVSPISKTVLGTQVHSYIGRDFVLTHANGMANRSIRTIAASINGSLATPPVWPFTMRPDLVDTRAATDLAPKFDPLGMQEEQGFSAGASPR